MEASTLDILNVVGTWIASIGTVGAVITSLWLASNTNRVKLKISAATNYMIDSSRQDNPEVCLINIVNLGIKPITITAIGWEVGKRKKKKSFIQNTRGSTLDHLPKTLLEHEDLNIDIAFIGREVKWIESMAKTAMENDIKTLVVVVATNIGKTFRVKADDGLIKSINDKKKELEDAKQV